MSTCAAATIGAPKQGVHAGQRTEADHHRHGRMNDVSERDDGESAPDHADGEQEEEDAGDVQGRGLPLLFERSTAPLGRPCSILA